MNERWKVKQKPPSMEARFQFSDFETLRVFLDKVAEQADKHEHHPNISFGRSHASIIIYSTGEELGEVDHALAQGIDDSFEQATT